MAITTTAHFTWSLESSVGHLYYIVKRRLAGTSIWTQYNTSGTTAVISGLAINMIYDFAVTNVNNDDNPTSAVSQDINITNPYPSVTPTNISVGYQFANLSTDITSYTADIALAASPSIIIATHILPPGSYPGTISDTFTGLNASTGYILTLIPAAGSFINTFTYPFTTTAQANCPAPTAVTATLS